MLLSLVWTVSTRRSEKCWTTASSAAVLTERLVWSGNITRGEWAGFPRCSGQLPFHRWSCKTGAGRTTLGEMHIYGFVHAWKDLIREKVGKVYRGRVDWGKADPKGAYFAGDGHESVHHFAKPLLIVHFILCSPQNNLRPKRHQPWIFTGRTDAEALGS